MSSQQQFQSQSYSYSTSSYSTSSSAYSNNSTSNPQGTMKRFTEVSSSNDRDGTTIRRTQEETGKPTVEEYTQIPAGGRQIPFATQGDGSGGERRRIEDVTDENEDGNENDAGRQYEERIEDEYAKREGGA